MGEKPGLDTKTSAVITSGDGLEWKVSPTATITHAFGALWDAHDFGDALYTFNVGLATSIARRLELKVELLDAFKSKPPNDLVKKNDVALLTAIVFKSRFNRFNSFIGFIGFKNPEPVEPFEPVEPVEPIISHASNHPARVCPAVRGRGIGRHLCGARPCLDATDGARDSIRSGCA